MRSTIARSAKVDESLPHRPSLTPTQDPRELRPAGRPSLTIANVRVSYRRQAASEVVPAILETNIARSGVVAIMSMSLDGYVADLNDGVAEVFDWDLPSKQGVVLPTPCPAGSFVSMRRSRATAARDVVIELRRKSRPTKDRKRWVMSL